MLAALKGIHSTQISVGGRTFRLVASPILNERNERLGTVVEWTDRTAEVAIEQEVSGIISAAAAGDFSRRIAADEMSGFFRQISSGINDLLLSPAGKILIAAGNLLCRRIDGIGCTLDRKNDLLQIVDRNICVVLQAAEHSLIFGLNLVG